MVEEEQEEVGEVVVEEDGTRPHRPCGDGGCWDYDSCFDIRAACPPVAVSPRQAWPALPDGELALHGMQWLVGGAYITNNDHHISNSPPTVDPRLSEPLWSQPIAQVFG